VPALLEVGHRVTVVDSFRWRQSSLAHVCHNPDLEIVRGDVRDHLLMPGLLDDADMVLPLAALVGAPLCDFDVEGAISTNRKAIEWLCESTDLPIIIPISNSGYGIGEPDKECTEDSPLRPISLYGRTKVQAEEAVLMRGNAISLRLATVFGMSPRMRVDLLANDFVYRAVTDRTVVLFEAHFRRNFIHVRDVARAFLHAIKNFDAMKDRPYNVGLSDANLTKRQLCERIKLRVPDFTFMEAEMGGDPDRRDYVVSNARIEAAGFKTAYSLDDGICELVKGFQMLRNTRYGNV
jgi:nucleoside-diphosphate-sugar epimerase